MPHQAESARLRRGPRTGTRPPGRRPARRRSPAPYPAPPDHPTRAARRCVSRPPRASPASGVRLPMLAIGGRTVRRRLHGVDARTAGPDDDDGVCRSARLDGRSSRRPRRPARARHRRGPRVPPRPRLAARRVPGCRRLLRRVRVPHHDTAAARGARPRADRARPVLDPASSPAPPGARRLRRGEHGRGAGRPPRPGRGHRTPDPRCADLLDQLGRDRCRLQLLRPDLAAAVHELLVARGRGAVLPRVAAGRGRPHGHHPGAARPAGPRPRRLPRGGRPVHGADGAPASSTGRTRRGSTTAPTPTSWD